MSSKPRSSSPSSAPSTRLNAHDPSARTTRFLISAGQPDQVRKMFEPKGELSQFEEPRVALVGRSNVGKSSLINSILTQDLAFVSKKPGKTRLINFFYHSAEKRILVDLPGYGFAKVSKDERQFWAGLMDSYFLSDPHLREIWVLLDARHGPTDADLEAIRFFLPKPFTVRAVFTKKDELKTQSDRVRREREVKATLAQEGIPETQIVWTSVRTGQGLMDLKHILRGLQ